MVSPENPSSCKNPFGPGILGGELVAVDRVELSTPRI